MRTTETVAQATREEWARIPADWEHLPSEMSNDELAEWLEKSNNALTATARYRDELTSEIVRRLRPA
jgi:truncated hemoglobin YjbI